MRPAPGGMPDSLGALRHRWWILALAALAGLGAAAGWLHAQEPIWESTTSVLVQPAGRDINVVGGRTQGQVNLDTEAQLVRSTAVAAGAADRLGSAVAPEELTRQVSVAVPPNTSVLTITFAARTPEQARLGSRAFAEAYLDHREQAARAELSRQAAAIEARRDELAATLTEINDRLTVTLPGTATAANLDSQRSTVTGQLNVLGDRLNELGTATISAGTIINEPLLPSTPAWPRPPVVLASGVALGLMAGLGLAAFAERVARRVRRPGDLSRRLGVPVLADLTPRATRLAVDPDHPVVSPYGPAGRVFDRLRNQLLAHRRPEREPAVQAEQVIVVASPVDQAASQHIAANLATSLARRGHQVVLLESASGSTTGEPPRRVPGAAARGSAPSLADVIAGRVTLAQALRRAPYHSGLQLLNLGEVTNPGILQSPALGSALAELTSQCGYVVAAAPPTGASADAQSLASHATVALLVVEARRNRLAQVADAVSQLQQVGTPLLGAVLVPPARRTVRPAAVVPPTGSPAPGRAPAAVAPAARLAPARPVAGPAAGPVPGPVAGPVAGSAAGPVGGPESAPALDQR